MQNFLTNFLQKALGLLPQSPYKTLTRRGHVDQIVIHESVTKDAATARAVLKKRGLGVDFIVDENGDFGVENPTFLRHYTQHAGPDHNERSVGLEVVNLYYPKHNPEGQQIQAVWAHQGRYLVPSQKQLETAWQAVQVLVKVTKTPLRFPCIDKEKGTMYWGRHKNYKLPGIMAHHRSNHADGLFIEYYCFLRSEGFQEKEAFDLALGAAQAGSRAVPLPEKGWLS